MIKHFELHGCINNMISIDEWWSWLHLVKQIGMVTNLFQLHEHVQELNTVFGPHSVHCCNITCDDSLIKLLLELCEANEHVDLLFSWQVMLDVDLESSEHEWLEQSVNLLDDLLLLFGIVFLSILKDEKICEIFCRFEKLWHEEI